MVLPAILRERHWIQSGVFFSIFCAILAIILLTLQSVFGPALAAPDTPQPILPGEGDLIVTPTFSWLSSPGAVRYQVQVGPQSNQNLVYWQSDTLNLNLTPSQATLPNELLYWRVGAYLSGDSTPSSWSNKISFSKTIPAPALQSPLDQAALVEPALTWGSVEGAASYVIEFDQDASFTSPDFSWTTYNTNLVPNTTISNGTYFWRVRGVDADGHEGMNSPVWTFTKYLPAPLTVVTDDANLVIPTLAWQAVPGAAYYRVEISQTSGFNPFDFTDITYATTLTPKPTLPNGAFYWRVRGVDAAGHEGANSSPRIFTKSNLGPELIAPADGISITLPELVWQPIEGASYYIVELSTVSTFNLVAFSYTTYNARLAPTQVLPANTYYWRVRGADAGQNTGSVSISRSFVLTDPLPVTNTNLLLQTPSNNETISIDPTFRWLSIKDAATYLIQVSTSPTFATIYDTVTTRYSSYTPYQAGTKYAYENGTYYWRVIAKNSNGTTLGTSPAGVFSKTMQIPQYGPSDGETLNVDPSFRWTQAVGAKSYYLTVSNSPTFGTVYDTVTTYYPAFTPYTAGTKYSYINGTYYWKVEARSSSGAVLTTSPARSFTKESRIRLFSPINNAELLTDPVFTWERVVGAKSYYLRVSTSPTFSTIYDSVTTPVTGYSPYTAGTKNAYINDIYYWKVEARSSSNATIATSQVYTFKKVGSFLCIEPPDGAVLGNAPTFRWEQIVGAKNYTLKVSTSPTFATIFDSVTTDYTTYTPELKVYNDNTYYWQVQAKNSSGAIIATTLAGTFTVTSSQPTSTPIGAPTATPSLTPSPMPPPELPPDGGVPPTPHGPRETAGPQPLGHKVLGNVTVYADSFTDLGESRWRASGNVRLGSAAVAYAVLGPGEAILDYGIRAIEGSSSSRVALLMDDHSLASVFAGPFQVDAFSGEVSALMNVVFQLTSLGDLGVDTCTPLVDFSMNVLDGSVTGKAKITIYPVEDEFPSALVDFTLRHTGDVSGGLGVGNLEFEAAGVTFSIESATLSYVPSSGGKITISSASITLPEAFNLGAQGSVEDLIISADGLESVGGGSITLELPEMAVPGTGGKFELAGAGVTLSLDAGGGYYIHGRADFNVPNIQSKGSPEKTYNGSLYAEFELDQDGLRYVLMGGEIEPGIPVGQSGFMLTKLEGRVDLSPVVRVQITGTLQTEIEVPPLGPLISGEPTVWVQLSHPYEIGISGSVKVLIFDAAQASLVLSQESGLTGSVHINYFPYAMEGDASLHVWRSGGEFHFTGSAGVTLGFHQGALGTYLGIDLPPADFTFANVATQFGEFCNDRYCASTVYGFKGAVDITINALCPQFGIPPFKECSINLASYAFFIDTGGNLDYGSSLDQYRLIDQATSLVQARKDGLETSDSVASTNVMTFSMGVTDLALVGMDWKTGAPILNLVDPQGITVTTSTVYPGLAYTSSLTSTAFLIANPKVGTWTALITNLTGSEDYTFRALGRNLPPLISLNGVARSQTETSAPQSESYTIHWTASDSDPDASLALYYDTDNVGEDGTLIAEGLIPSTGSYIWYTSQVKTGRYYVYASIDDLKNLPVTSYFSGTVTVANTQPPSVPTGVRATVLSSQKYVNVCWNINPEIDVIGYHVYFGSQPDFYDLGVFNATNLPCIDLSIPGWVNTGYLALTAYDNSGNESSLSTAVQVVIYRNPIYLPLVKR